ncbi:sensor histidine kinase [Cellulosimicrobium protaetiae]|uniref:histidine kinase n=1 Tax=Cellulosimicrobium protaetiae TaxID=2587808 RepID=A0A6M5UAK0_9MICO|nr:ATP-binding protein [Cellulosimicrobium protaetiae]QJW35526.1 HAMP domain-containing protein [Cellulosimicrobium protaetiae]
MSRSGSRGPRLTLRARLTVVHAALFVVAGAVVLALTWALVRQRLVGEASLVSASFCCTAPDESPVAPGQEITYEVLVGLVGAARGEALTAVLTQGALALVTVGALAAWAGWLLAGRMLRPLSTITATAHRIAESPDAARRMHERIGMDGPRDEVTELADTFDGMLGRLDDAFDAQRRFVANASHELRTPLTLHRALVEVAVERPGASDDVRRLGESLLDVTARQERLLDGLLLLARSERGLADRRFVDLADVVEHVLDPPPGAPAPDLGVRVEASCDEAPTSGDPLLLEQLVRNLVENAVRHNLPHGWVRVTTRSDAAGDAVLEVANSGPPVAPDDLAGLFEPFRRLGGERTGAGAGSGLGLSIVRAVVAAHGGDVTLAARTQGGLVVTVRLPGEAYEVVPADAG